ncbi:MAG: glycosyltransferase family 2 protein [Flavobacteriaceae bacterium]
MMAKVLIIVPCYNEGETICNTLLELKANLKAGATVVYDVLVINDCSTDNSLVEIQKSKTEVINLPLNLGIGGAMQTGFEYAKRHKYDIAIQFDGDGQHDSSFIPDLLQPIKEERAQVVIGSRFINKEGFQSNYLRRLGIKYFSYLNALLVGVKILDVTSGFRALNVDAIQTVCDYYPENYPEPESIILFKKDQLNVVEVPVLMRSRQGGKSSINGFDTFFYMFKVTISSILLYIRMKLSKQL